MQIKVPKINSNNSGSLAVTDEETGNAIGNLLTKQGSDAGGNRTPSRKIRLFGKYIGQFESHEECVAFAKGVEEVLNYMTRMEK
jgi:hypothetical protein